jgi:hypothetical protein
MPEEDAGGSSLTVNRLVFYDHPVAANAKSAKRSEAIRQASDVTALFRQAFNGESDRVPRLRGKVF